ncbi:hypothetical protein Pmar_PMAR010290 [Perkinsus marinus ATCC 50983]|uniref:Uncharacterized protein n=1 Tax=Perkinsus marinus (strain ATCC 50983 / TXsc) TaxID=423536 RepID=C5K5C2_PERM5|nr:hypothetical protein Pmar_PMAR010290 [Perkinsus marinus ATCC 50983]EER20544.1 hypothetical protein Pmar_PMAR010290 [Perkinsus marinus ATCC 50983]|eukprot:XP_002788748.1 hypothetical protein Pmar_PMAR010290 [Perkinsus marinus ATCC 50983]
MGSGGRCFYYNQSGNGGYQTNYGNGGYQKGYGNGGYQKTYGNGGYQKSYGNGGYQKSYGNAGYGQKQYGNGGYSYGNGQGFRAGGGGNGNTFYKKSWSGNKFGGYTKPALPINQFYYTDNQAGGKNIRLKLDFGNVVRNPEASGNIPMKLVLTQPAVGETPAKVNEFAMGWKGAGQILALNFRNPEATSSVETLCAAEGSAQEATHARIGQNKGHLMSSACARGGNSSTVKIFLAQDGAADDSN